MVTSSKARTDVGQPSAILELALGPRKSAAAAAGASATAGAGGPAAVAAASGADSVAKPDVVRFEMSREQLASVLSEMGKISDAIERRS